MTQYKQNFNSILYSVAKYKDRAEAGIQTNLFGLTEGLCWWKNGVGDINTEGSVWCDELNLGLEWSIFI